VQDLLTHLYVLIPVLDNASYTYVGADEVDKLLQKSERWLPDHPEKELIARRYLSYRQELGAAGALRMEIVREDSGRNADATDARQEAQETEAKRLYV